MSRSQSTDPMLLAQRPAATTAPVTQGEISFLFQHFLRAPAFFRESRLVFRAELLDPVSEAAYRVLWQVICQAHDTYSADAFGSRLVTYLLSVYLRNSADQFGPETVETLTAMRPGCLVYDAFHLPSEDFSIPVARDILRRLLYEREVVGPLFRAAQAVQWGEAYPAQLGDLATAISERHRRNSNLNVLPLVSPVIPLQGETQPAFIFHPLGLPFIDEAVGGNCEGSVYGILGATGSGKTTLSCQIAGASVRESYLTSQQTGDVMPMTVYVSAEQPCRELRPMIQSYLMRIPRSTLMTFTDYRCLTTEANPAPYERQMLRDSAVACGELERWLTWQPIIERGLAMVDFSRGADFPEAGTGSVDEVVSVLERLVEMRQQPIRCVMIDWVGCLVSRHVAARNKDENAYRHILGDFIDRVKSEIALKFRCTVWAAHQLAGKARGFSPMKLIGLDNAAECKSFADHAAGCVVICNEDQSSGCRYLHWSKVRMRAAPPAPRIVRIHDLFAEFEDVSSRYRSDATARCFITNEMASALADLAPSSAGRPASGPQAGPPGRRSTDQTVDRILGG